MPLSVEPIAAWNFNNSPIDSIGSEDGIVHGAIYDPTIKKLGSHSIKYDPIDDWFEIPTGDTPLNLTGNLSCMIWILTAQNNVNLISFGNSTTGATGYLLGLAQGPVANGKPSFLSSGGGGWNGASVAVNDGNWHQIISVIEGTNLRFFVDGVYDSLHTGVSPPVSHVGQRAMGALNTGAGGFGAINQDTTGIWDVALDFGGVSLGQLAGGDIAVVWNGGAGIEFLGPVVAAGRRRKILMGNC